MSNAQINPQAAIDLEDAMDTWYGCAKQAAYLTAQALAEGHPMPEARRIAQERYEADPDRTSTGWKDEMFPQEVMDAAADFMHVLTNGEHNNLTLDDFVYTADENALRATIPTGDFTVSAHLVLAAAEHPTR